MIKTAKNNMYKTKIEKGKDDPRTIWKIFKVFGASRKKATSEMINGLKENDRQISDDKEMANVFNKYFVNKAAQLKGPVEKTDFKHIKECTSRQRSGKGAIRKRPPLQKRVY